MCLYYHFPLSLATSLQNGLGYALHRTPLPHRRPTLPHPQLPRKTYTIRQKQKPL